MNRRRTTAFLTAALVAVGLGTAPLAGAEDPSTPTGSFTITPTSAYVRGLVDEYHFGTLGYVRVTVTTTALSPGAYVDTIDPGAGDGNGEHGGSSKIGAEYKFTLGPGTFTPRVYVTNDDAEHHTGIVTLPTLTYTKDPTPPELGLELPPASALNSAAAWRSLHGHVADPETSIYDVAVTVMQRRARIWYVWGSVNQRWRKGTRNETWTLLHVKPAQLKASLISGSRWLQPPVKELTKGALVVRIRTRSLGVGETSLVQRAVLTRR